MFQFIKSMILGWAPNKFNTFLSKFIQRGSNSTKIFHKTPIETSKTVKASYLTNIHRSRPILYSFNFRCIYLNSIFRNNISQKYDLIFAKCALINIAIKLIIKQHLQNLSDMSTMFRFIAAVN